MKYIELGLAVIKVCANIAIYGAIPAAIIVMGFRKQIGAWIQERHLEKNL